MYHKLIIILGPKCPVIPSIQKTHSSVQGDQSAELFCPSGPGAQECVAPSYFQTMYTNTS